MGTEAIEGISLDMSKIKEMHLNPHVFRKMHKLRFIRFYSSCRGDNNNKLLVSQGIKSVLTELRYFHWHGCPLKSLGPKIHPQNLVSLEMPHSNVERLWNGVPHLVKLKHVNLSHSKHLKKIPDLCLAHNLEILNLEGCTGLSEAPSFQYLNKLAILNLRHCKSLSSPPTEIHSKKVILSGCLNLKAAPNISCNIEELHLDGTAIRELSSTIEQPSRLLILNLQNCSRLENLSSSICKLKSLKYLYLSYCSKLDRLPDNLGDLESLKVLKAEGITIREIPPSIACLNNLDMLFLERCKDQEQMDLILPPLLGLHGLRSLNLCNCHIKELPDSLGQLSSLEDLYLGVNHFESIPASIIILSNLLRLDLSYCHRLRSLPMLPCNLELLEAQSCTSLEMLLGLPLISPNPWNGSSRISFVNCFKLDKNALRVIVEDALLNIQQNPTVRLEVDEEYLGNPLGCICFPGSEIPEWYSFQNNGSFITFKLPPDWFSVNFHGFAVSVVVEFPDYNVEEEDIYVACELQLKSEDSLHKNVATGSLWIWHSENEPAYIESDHVFLGYDCNIHIEPEFHDFCNNTEALIQFHVVNVDDRCIECCQVKKAGVRLLYAQDCEEAMNEEE